MNLALLNTSYNNLRADIIRPLLAFFFGKNTIHLFYSLSSLSVLVIALRFKLIVMIKFLSVKNKQPRKRKSNTVQGVLANEAGWGSSVSSESQTLPDSDHPTSRKFTGSAILIRSIDIHNEIGRAHV